MQKLILSAILAAAALPATPALADPGNGRGHGHGNVAHRDDNRQRGHDQRDFGRSHKGGWQGWDRYDYNRPDPHYGAYRAERYYRDGRYYQVRRLSNDDRIYRGSNGRYYCRRNDGTTGLIIGAIGGGLLGNAIAPNGSETLGIILGGGAGALLGRSIDRNGVRCR
ncbi:MAG: glycine zipper 2TM domain-containing protein [Novosphingobium sp.]